MCPEPADLRASARQDGTPVSPPEIGDLAHPEDGYQRSVMCLTAWLITNAGAGLCIRMRRGNSLISAAWPRLATLARGSPARPVQASTHWWDAIGSGVTHAGMRAEALPRRVWGWLGSSEFLEFPVSYTHQLSDARSGSGPQFWAFPLRRTVPKGRAK